MGCHFLLQGIFPTQGSNPGLPHCREILHHGATMEAPQGRRMEFFCLIPLVCDTFFTATSRNTAATHLDREISKTGVLVLNSPFLLFGHLQYSEIRARDLGNVSCQRGQGSPSALGQFSHQWYSKQQLPCEDTRQGSGCPALCSYLQPGSPSFFRNKSPSTPGHISSANPSSGISRQTGAHRRLKL